MIAADRRESILANPVDTGQGIRGVVDDVAQKQTRIESLIDRRQRWPVCMDVGQQKNSHGALGSLFDENNRRIAGMMITRLPLVNATRIMGKHPRLTSTAVWFDNSNHGSRAGFTG
jgi:hypothetical protein